MDDLKMERLCAEAMGLENPRVTEYTKGSPFVTYGPSDQAVLPQYCPLQSDLQAMALAKSDPLLFSDIVVEWRHTGGDLNRLIVTAFARIQKAKKAA